MTCDQIASLRPALVGWIASFGDCFCRRQTFGHFQAYLLGLLADVPRKSVEPMALAMGVAVRTLQEFLSHFVWDHDRLRDQLQRRMIDQHGGDEAIGVIDETGHPKQGDKTPGVQRQYCGQSGKIDNCVVAVHLLYTTGDGSNPLSGMLDTDLFLPASWDDDSPATQDRRQEAGIPESLHHRPKWRIAVEQVRRAIGNGVRFSWLTFDEHYGMTPGFWFELDAMGQRAIGEVPPNFRCWPTPPKYKSLQGPHASKRVDRVVQHSPVFYRQDWQTVTVKDATRGPIRWRVKAARVQLPDTSGGITEPTDRRYWLIVAKHVATDEVKYFVSNAAESASLAQMLTAAFTRWQVEQWFARAKQRCGLGAFEVRKYVGLMRHWLCCAVVMAFLSAQTCRLRGEKRADHVRAGHLCGRDVVREDHRRVLPLLA